MYPRTRSAALTSTTVPLPSPPVDASVPKPVNDQKIERDLEVALQRSQR